MNRQSGWAWQPSEPMRCSRAASWLATVLSWACWSEDTRAYKATRRVCDASVMSNPRLSEEGPPQAGHKGERSWRGGRGGGRAVGRAARRPPPTARRPTGGSRPRGATRARRGGEGWWVSSVYPGHMPRATQAPAIPGPQPAPARPDPREDEGEPIRSLG